MAKDTNIEFMENGSGEFKTIISKDSIVNVCLMLKDKEFKKEYDFSIQYYGEKYELIFYNIECKEAYERIVNV